MAQPYPLPRETRETDILQGDGGATYGPFDFRIFDTADIRAYVRPEGGEWGQVPVAATKVAGAAFDHFTVTFSENLPATSDFVIQGARLHERQVAVSKAGALSANELEKELSKQGATIEELRRDVDQAGKAAFGTVAPILGTAASKNIADFADALQGAKADSAVQPAREVNTGTGLTGGGDLSANRTIALSTGALASLEKADSAVQPGALGTAAAQNVEAFAPAALGLPPGGVPGQLPIRLPGPDGSAGWTSAPEGMGDMLASAYDSQGKGLDVYPAAHHTYDKAGTILASDTVQGAVDELAGALAGLPASSDVPATWSWRASEAQPLPSDLVFSRASPATRITRRGLLESVPAHVARHQYAADGRYRGVQVEGSATNTLLHSDAVNNAAWSKTNAVPVPDAAVGPYGTQTAEKLRTNSASASAFYASVEAYDFVAGTTYVFPAVMKAGELTWAMLRLPSAAFGGDVRASANLAAGTMSLVGPGSVSVEPLGNGWARYRVTATATATTTSYARLHLAEAANDITLDGDGASGIYVEGIDIVAAPAVTSHIITEGTTATRAADDLTRTLTADIFNAAEGTIYWEGSLEPAALAQPYCPIWFARENEGRGISVAYDAANNAFRMRWRDASVNRVAYCYYVPQAGEDLRIVAWWKIGVGFGITVNGVSSAPTSNTASAVPTALWVGRGIGATGEGGDALYGHLCTRQIGIWDRALSDGATMAKRGIEDKAQQAVLAVPAYTGRMTARLSSVLGGSDREAFYPKLKAYLDSLIANPTNMPGAILFDRNWNWRLAARPASYLTAPSGLYEWERPWDAQEMGYSASAPVWFQGVNGTLGTPLAVQHDVVKRSTRTFTLPDGQVAALGWQRGDRMLLRATEATLTMGDAGGAFSLKDDVDTHSPAMATWAPATGYTANTSGVFFNGYSYRCASSHTSNASFAVDLAAGRWVLTGLNAKAEELVIESIAGNTVTMVWEAKDNYAQSTAKPVLQRIEGGGEYRLLNPMAIGVDKNQPWKDLWQTATSYALGDGVYVGSTAYMAAEAHTSGGSFATDLAAGKWTSLGSDRLFAFTYAKKVHIEGGDVRAMSGMMGRFDGVQDLRIDKMRGRGNNHRGKPGGWLYVGGLTSGGYITDTHLIGGSQPMMMSSTVSTYGITRGLTWNQCRTEGSGTGFAQHALHDDTTYNQCEVDGASPQAVGGSAFDIRSRSIINGGRADNITSPMVLLRGNFSGTVIDGLKGRNNWSGIRIDDTESEYLSGPPGHITVQNCQLLDLGGDSYGGICLVVGNGWSSMPGQLGRAVVQNNDMTFKSGAGAYAIQLAGQWTNPIVKGNVGDRSAGSTYAGRIVYMHGAGWGDSNAPINPVSEGNWRNSNMTPTAINNWQGVRKIYRDLMIGALGTGDVLLASKISHDWASINGAFGAFESTTVTVTGARVGDRARAWMNLATGGIWFDAKVTSDDTATVWAIPFTGGAIDLATATLFVEVVKQ